MSAHVAPGLLTHEIRIDKECEAVGRNRFFAKEKNFMRRKNGFDLLLFLAFLAGCAQVSLSSTPAVSELVTLTSESPVPVITSTKAVRITPTITLTREKTATPTPTPDFRIRSWCPPTKADWSVLPELSGTIVLAGGKIALGDEGLFPASNKKSLLLFWNTTTDEKIEYQLQEREGVYYFVTPPNKQRLAFTGGKPLSITTDVIVLAPQGREETRFSLPDDWTLFDWLNNEQLLVRQLRDLGENIGLVAINPFTGERQFLPYEFPNIYTREAPIRKGAWTIFDPTISFVIYSERLGEHSETILWNTKTNEEITRFSRSDWAKWSPDGRRLVVVIEERPELFHRHHEIKLVYPTGEVVRVTNFRENFGDAWIDLPTWSPDGRYITFWLRTDLQSENADLAVLDLQTDSVDLYCLGIEPFPRSIATAIQEYSRFQAESAPPVWSPDGKYILVEDKKNGEDSITYLVDTQNHSIIQVAKGARPAGWLVSP